MELGNVLILGDSYSTYEGWIPQGYPPHYQDEGGEDTDVRDVRKTWWHQVLTHMDGKLVLNSSYSGSTICHTGYFGEDCAKTSFVGRLDELVQEGFFARNRIDTVFVFGGTNDSWAGVPIGTAKWVGWKKEDLYSFAPACCYLMSQLRIILPSAKVCCILNTDLRENVEKTLVMACSQTAAKVIKLYDIEKAKDGHPTSNGMAAIYHRILDVLNGTKQEEVL